MSNQIYYGSTYTSGGVGGYTLRAADPYLPSAIGSSRYSTDGFAIADVGERTSSLSSSQTNGLKLSSVEIRGVGGGGSYSLGKIGGAPTSMSWLGVDGLSDVGSKRSAEALYNQSILAYNTIGQSDALLSKYSLVKRPRVVSASHLPLYPERPGEKDCAYYMMTRTCKFGDACKFDHPIWVPEGGIPDWKEVPHNPAPESLPERPGEPDCPYFLKTQKCKYGLNCKFNHPKEKLDSSTGVVQSNEIYANSELPERPSEPVCAFYAKTGKCKFGGNCKFHHPKDTLIQSAGKDIGSAANNEPTTNNDNATNGYSKQTKTFIPFTPALWHNSKGLPIRPGETDCPFYLKTGSCKYGATCRYSHPDRYLISTPVTANINNAIITPPVATVPVGVINPAASFLPSLDPRLSQFGVGAAIYPQRPGEIECDYYMKTGQCKFAERCRFHHPIDRSAPIASVNKQAQQAVKLSLAGLPRREGSVACPFYMKTGTCKYGAMCRFDHPPPGEAIAMSTIQESGEVEKDEAEIGQ
ncbi:zinc finger CCCH domain-containing protein 8 isoform X1 [Dendrobium catenatum]|uniref:Zinc finger ccch domain-containing protein 37 n=1 Tax=Dendrobium nobile TaxID=94219 RepID=A0A7T0FY52_DENNO|nr:zinc finger CCCH domain-containing protein 8 isoform X1 [Dendrobium catenatum]QPJ58219.1 zinc finger ccch domain-containing protein 37 [Dendrobium nobile]